MNKTHRVKYPRTFHLPWSEGKTHDDKTLPDVSHFTGREVVVTVKLDGENTSIYSDYTHARSLDSSGHWSRSWIKAFQGEIGHNIPANWRICGENMTAVHSIEYTDLKSYFYGFSIWNEVNTCISWDDTLVFFELLGIEHVPILYRGVFDETVIRKLYTQEMYDTCEGYVVRLADAFEYRDFNRSVAKFVRKDHVVCTDEHWFYGSTTVKKNTLSPTRHKYIR